MKFKLTLFIGELVMFATAMLLGAFVAYRHAPVLSSAIGQQVSFSWTDIILIAVFAVLAYFVVGRFRKVRTVVLYFLFAVTVLVGSEVVLSAFWKTNWISVLSFLFLITVFVVRRVFTHNLAIILGIVGVSTLIGIGLKPFSAVVLLVIFSLYDIVAVYLTRHMVTMARGMIESGVVFGFIVPNHVRGFWEKPKQANQNIGENFMILGSGDSGLPLILVASASVNSLTQGLIVGVFACAGLLLTHVLFINQRKKRAMAALPPIATMAIIGYLVATLF